MVNPDLTQVYKDDLEVLAQRLCTLSSISEILQTKLLKIEVAIQHITESDPH